MNIPADQFLAGPAFSIYKDAAVGGRDDADLLSQRLDRDTLSDNVKPFLKLVPQQASYPAAVREAAGKLLGKG